MKNLKKIKLKAGAQVLDDGQLKKIVGGAYVEPPTEAGPVERYCKIMKCQINGSIGECWGACYCTNTMGYTHDRNLAWKQ